MAVLSAWTRRVSQGLPNAVYWPLLIAAPVSMAVLFLMRLQSVLQAHGKFPTSGYESSGALGVYQVCAGLPLYHDFANSPNVYAFNYIFYETYGALIGLFGDCATMTPLIGRLLTVAALLGLAAAIFLARSRRLHVVEAAAIALAVLSPYVGWWALALRPDVGASLFLALAVIATMRYLRRPTLPAVVVAVACLIFAWGFKQPFGVAAPVMLYYIARTNLRDALVFALLLAAGLGLPFLVYGIRPYFLHTVYFAGGAPLVPIIGLINIALFIAKVMPVLILAGVALTAFGNDRRDKERNFLVALLALSFPVMAFLAGKVGAADNYFFPTFVVALLLIVRLAPECDPPLRRIGFAAYAALSIVSSLAVLSGQHGQTALPAANLALVRDEAAMLNRMPGPKLVWNDIVAMPWMTDDVALRIAFGDDLGTFDAAKPVAAGRYATVAIPPYAASQFDLSGYDLIKTFPDMLIYSARRP